MLISTVADDKVSSKHHCRDQSVLKCFNLCVPQLKICDSFHGVSDFSGLARGGHSTVVESHAYSREGIVLRENS